MQDTLGQKHVWYMTLNGDQLKSTTLEFQLAGFFQLLNWLFSNLHSQAVKSNARGIHN